MGRLEPLLCCLLMHTQMKQTCIFSISSLCRNTACVVQFHIICSQLKKSPFSICYHLSACMKTLMVEEEISVLSLSMCTLIGKLQNVFCIWCNSVAMFMCNVKQDPTVLMASLGVSLSSPIKLNGNTKKKQRVFKYNYHLQNCFSEMSSCSTVHESVDNCDNN